MSDAQPSGLTDYVAGFVCNTTLKELPNDVIELGKKSMLDGIGNQI